MVEMLEFKSSTLQGLLLQKLEQKVVGEDLATYERDEIVHDLEETMLAAAQELDFERAAELRDQIKAIQRPHRT